MTKLVQHSTNDSFVAGDLDRIKSTSFFQRIPTASEIKQQQQQQEPENKETPEDVEAKAVPTVSETAIVQVSESDSEEEEEEDIFDTSYIDVIASGEVKLAYIPGRISYKKNRSNPAINSHLQNHQQDK